MKNKDGKVTIGILIGIIIILLIIIVALLILREKDKKNNSTLNENDNKNVSSNLNIDSDDYSISNENIGEIDDVENTNNTSNSLNKENIVLFYGLDISNEDLEVSIPYTEESKEKYEIKYYNYENGKFIGECEGKLVETYEGVASVQNTSKIAMSQNYNAIPRQYSKVEEIPEELMEFADCNSIEIHSVDLDGDNNLEYIMAYGTYASPDDYDVEEYSNYSEILIFDNSFNKIATLVKAENQFWHLNGEVTDEFFCSLDDVEYIDIDNDGVMEILVDTHVYEGTGVNIYKYENGKITGDIDYSIYALP